MKKNFKKKPLFIMSSFLIAILVMSVGYSTFATQLLVNGTVAATGEWDVKITGIDVQEISDGCDSGIPEFTDTSVTFDAKLKKPGDSITYAVTIKNNGTIDAVLEEVIFMSDEEGSSAILYETNFLSNDLPAGSSTTLTIKAIYDEKTTEIPATKTKKITGTIHYIQK